MKKIVALCAFVLSLALSSSAKAGGGPAPIQIDAVSGGFGVSWVKHDPGSKIVDIYGYSSRLDQGGSVGGCDDSCRLRASDNGLANSWAFNWMSGIGRTVACEYGAMICPSGSFCDGKVFGGDDAGIITYCDIAADGLTASSCATVPTFKSNAEFSIGGGSLLTSSWGGNAQVYSVDYISGASTLLPNCSAVAKTTVPAGLPTNGFLYLTSNRSGTLGGTDLWRIKWTGADCSGSATNLNSLAGYGNANTALGESPGAVDPLTGDVYYMKESGAAFRLKLKPTCGDGFISGLDEAGGEECDSAAANPLNAQTCQGLGFSGGTLKCSPLCKFDTALCTSPAVCNNGIKEAGEQCDKSDFGGASCASIKGAGWTGSLLCAANCMTVDSSGCSPPAPVCGDKACNGVEDCSTCPGDCGKCCGNGVIDAGESCDGALLGGATCASVLGAGYSGSLSCKADCATFDTSGCKAPVTCQNGVLDVGEQCDGANFGAHNCATEMGVGYTGSLICSAQCAIDSSGCVPPPWGIKVTSGGCTISGQDPLSGAIQTVNGVCSFSFTPKYGLTANNFEVKAASVVSIPFVIAALPDRSSFTVPQGVVWTESETLGNKKQFGFGQGIVLGDEGTGFVFDTTGFPIVSVYDSAATVCFGIGSYDAKWAAIDVGNGIGCLSEGYHVEIDVVAKSVVTPPWKDGADGGAGGSGGAAGGGQAGNGGAAGNGGNTGTGGHAGNGGAGGATGTGGNSGTGGSAGMATGGGATGTGGNVGTGGSATTATTSLSGQTGGGGDGGGCGCSTPGGDNLPSGYGLIGLALMLAAYYARRLALYRRAEARRLAHARRVLAVRRLPVDWR